jgi:hypothetical protein
MSSDHNLRNLQFSPSSNPLLEPQALETKRRYVRAGRGRDLLDPLTGEVSAIATVYTVEERDDEQFVKVFADGVKAAFGLTKTAHRVFQAILDEYQSTPMSKGYADSIYLHFMDDGLSGLNLQMSEKTFQRGLKELLAKSFIAPKTPSVYWVNPALFFKGDRVAFVKEYRRRKVTEQDDLELAGQLRIDD